MADYGTRKMIYEGKRAARIGRLNNSARFAADQVLEGMA